MATKEENKVIQTLEEAAIVLKLRDYGVAELVVTFSGGGDSGGIDEVEYYASENQGQYINHSVFDIGFADDLFYRIIDDQTSGTGDWVNNDGGYGTLYISLIHNDYKLECNFNTTEHFSWDEQPFK